MCKIPICKDCRWFCIKDGDAIGRCIGDHGYHLAKDELCAMFETHDKKRPKFCELANSVDAMAEALATAEFSSSIKSAPEVPGVKARMVLDSTEAKEAALNYLLQLCDIDVEE